MSRKIAHAPQTGAVLLVLLCFFSAFVATTAAADTNSSCSSSSTTTTANVTSNGGGGGSERVDFQSAAGMLAYWQRFIDERERDGNTFVAKIQATTFRRLIGELATAIAQGRCYTTMPRTDAEFVAYMIAQAEHGVSAFDGDNLLLGGRLQFMQLTHYTCLGRGGGEPLLHGETMLNWCGYSVDLPPPPQHRLCFIPWHVPQAVRVCASFILWSAALFLLACIVLPLTCTLGGALQSVFSGGRSRY